MLDTINDMQRTLGQQSRDYVKEPEIKNLWSAYWSMNDKMTDTLRKLESEHKGPKPVQFSEEHSDQKTETETYTETITWNRTASSEETLAKRKLRRGGPTRPSNSIEENFPAQLIPETRSWEPPLEYTEETEIVGTTPTPMNMPVAMAPEEEATEPAEVEQSPKAKKKGGVVEELLREWTTVYD